MRRSTVAFVAMLALLVLPAVAGASAFPGTNGRIAFSQESGAGTSASIVTANPDGSAQTQVTSGHVDLNPRLSADGKSIVFTRGGFPSSTSQFASHVMLVHSDGTGLTDLSTADAGTAFSDRDPSFSPDGTQIVFDRFDLSTGTFRGIFKMAVTGSATPVQLTSGTDFEPTWSPDGTRVAFVKQMNGSTDAIFTTSPNSFGGPFQQVTHPQTDSSDFTPDYSPNGTRIAFSRDGSILTTNADGSGTPTVLTHSSPPVFDHNPAYSPDGTKIIFASTRGTQGQVGPGGSQAYGLYTMNSSDGGGLAPVPGLAGNASFSNMEPDWGTAAVTQPPTPPPSGGCGSGDEPDRNGDLHSNCHTGAKGRGAGGNDKPSSSSTVKKKR